MTSSKPATRGDARGFRPVSRRRARIALGALLAAVAIGGNVLVYSQLGDRTEVLQLVDNVRPGQQITSDMLRVVEVDVDPNVQLVRATDLALVDRQYATTYLISGTLIAPQLVQPGPLVTPGAAVVALELRPTQVPTRAHEQSEVLLVVPTDGDQPPTLSTGRIVWIGEADNIGSVLPVEVEVPLADAQRLVLAKDIGLILVDPGGGHD